MRQIILPFLIVLLAPLIGCNPKNIDRDARDKNFTHVKSEDAEMNAAIAEANATFPKFLSALRDRKPTCRDFGVKKPYATPGGGNEHIWIADINELDGEFEGTISNDAYETKLVKNGQRVRFSASEISDWKYVDADVLVGGFTIRYFVNRMTPEEKDALEKEVGFRIK